MLKNTKRTSFNLSWAVLILIACFGNRAQAADIPANLESVEVSLGQVFVPETGYGSNNVVQLTLDGYLPNSCYQLGNYKVEVGAEPNTLIVHQYANLQKDNVCADSGTLPVHLANIVPFTYDVSVGRLHPGDYKVIFNQSSGNPRSRKFHIYSSKNMTVDDHPYAGVSTVSMADVVNGLYPLTADLMGTFTSTCSYIADLKVIQENDVTVVEPILGHRTNVVCAEMLVPFKTTVNLGKLDEGRHLVHVRSMSGKSVSHAFSVITPDPSIR